MLSMRAVNRLPSSSFAGDGNLLRSKNDWTYQPCTRRIEGMSDSPPGMFRRRSAMIATRMGSS